MATRKRKLIFKKFKLKLRPGFLEFLKHVGLELVVFWVSLALVVFVLVIIFKPLIEQWMVSVFIRVQQFELKEEVLVETPIGPISRVPLQGSFTELFSGVGWRNPITSTVYQDFKTLIISFPPAYDWEEIGADSRGFSLFRSGDTRIVSAKGNGREVLFVTSGGEVGFIGPDEKVTQLLRFNLNNGSGEVEPHYIALDYDRGVDRWLVAVSDINGVDVFEFQVGEQILKLSSVANITTSDVIVLGLACLNGRCVLVADKKLYGISKTFSGWDVKEISLPYEAHSVGIGKTDSAFIVGLVSESGDKYEGNLYEIVDGELRLISFIGAVDNGSDESLFSSTYPGEIYFGFNDESNEVLAVYAAFEGQAYKLKFEIQNSEFIILDVEDYTRFFTTRVMNEGRVHPEIFYKDGAWWVSSRPASTEAPAGPAKFLRIRGSVANDLTLELISSIGLVSSIGLIIVPGFDENNLYGILDDGSFSRIYRFRDAGFERNGKLVWESLRLNAWEGEIVRGRFTRIDDGPSASGDGSRIKYFLSNNGGKKWIEIELNEFVEFNKRGGDFRWRAELYPSKDNFQSPWIGQVRVEYFVIRN